MIELRWVKRAVPAPEYGEGIAVEVKVLQCRVGRADSRRHSWDIRFGDWHDVPAVEDEG